MNTQRQMYRAAIVVTFGLVLLVTGCNGMLVGSWKTDPEPKDQEFYIKSVQFKQDANSWTYSAIAQRSGEVEKLNGTYDFDGFKLKLHAPGKPDRVYGATYNSFMKTLDVKAGDKKQTLKKQ